MITKARLIETINGTSEQWRTKNKELFSCFDQDKLWEVVHAFNDLEPDAGLEAAMKSIDCGEPNKRSIMRAVISELGPNEVDQLEAALELALDRAFITLWDRGALNSLFVVEEIPSRAQRDLDRMAARVEAAKPKAPAAPVAPPPPPEDPVDVCVRDWHELGSTAFQKKYISDTRNRPYYEAAIDAGRI
jgi:hypothetical protein